MPTPLELHLTRAAGLLGKYERRQEMLLTADTKVLAAKLTKADQSLRNCVRRGYTMKNHLLQGCVDRYEELRWAMNHSEAGTEELRAWCKEHGVGFGCDAYDYLA